MRLRARLQPTPEVMAETLGGSFVTVNRWENGSTAPADLALRQLRRIAPLTFDKG
jgi:DNA-binding transcriptional regulator YiaG